MNQGLHLSSHHVTPSSIMVPVLHGTCTWHLVGAQKIICPLNESLDGHENLSEMGTQQGQHGVPRRGAGGSQEDLSGKGNWAESQGAEQSQPAEQGKWVSLYPSPMAMPSGSHPGPLLPGEAQGRNV